MRCQVLCADKVPGNLVFESCGSSGVEYFVSEEIANLPVTLSGGLFDYHFRIFRLLEKGDNGGPPEKDRRDAIVRREFTMLTLLQPPRPYTNASIYHSYFPTYQPLEMNHHPPTPMTPAMLQQQQRYRTQQAAQPALNLPPQAAGVHVAQEGAKIAALFDIYDNAKRPEKAPAKAIPNISAARRQPGAGTKFHQPETCRVKEHPTWGGSGDTASPVEASAIVQRQAPPPLIQAAPQLPQHAQGIPVQAQAQGVRGPSQHQQPPGPVQGFPGAQGLPGLPQRQQSPRPANVQRQPLIQAAPQLPQHAQGIPVQYPQVYQPRPPFPYPVNNEPRLIQGPPMNVPPPGVHQQTTVAAETTLRHTQQRLTSQRFQMQPQQRTVYGHWPPPQPRQQGFAGYAGAPGQFGVQQRVQQDPGLPNCPEQPHAHRRKKTIDCTDVTKETEEWITPCPRVGRVAESEGEPSKAPEAGVTRHDKENNRFNPLK
ncbi:hypothetical protein BDZ89DRAFT_1040641 [Hymenopellis radicata]|nr:hypothetical protein BDZ89DRAFT_1040641 [Hymenopellis radicata]